MKNYRQRKSFFFSQKFFEYYCRIFFKIYAPLKVFGKENIPNSSVILSSNHCSHLDTVILAIATGRGFTKLGMLAARDYWFDSFCRFFFINSFINLIPIDRDKGVKKRISLDQSIDFCNEFISYKKDRGIVIYPEGTRSQTSKLLPFKNGSAIFSAKLRLPLLPIYIKGSLEAWPKYQLLIKPRRLEVFIGEPIYPDSVIPKKYLLQWNKTEIKPYIKKLTEELEKSIKKIKK